MPPTEPSPEREPLTLWCVLDELDSTLATYTGPNECHVTIDRAAYNSNFRPQTVRVIVGGSDADL